VCLSNYYTTILDDYVLCLIGLSIVCLGIGGDP
jgi:hypothetical protein